MKRIIYLLVSIALITGILVSQETSFAYENPFKIDDYGYEDINTLDDEIQNREVMMEAANNMKDAAKILGYDDSHAVIELANNEYQSYQEEKDSLEKIKNILITKWENKRFEYPEATYVWERLKQAGYSDHICAGILGNIITEVSDDSLNIQPLTKTTKYYGICQWSSYYPEVWGLTLEGQCNFLLDTIEKEFEAFSKMPYDDFLAIEDCRQAALRFAKVYERCSAFSYKSRQDNAVIAYNYFVS